MSDTLMPKGFLFAIFNTWQSLHQHIRMMNLCRQCLHKYHGRIT